MKKIIKFTVTIILCLGLMATISGCSKDNKDMEKMNFDGSCGSGNAADVSEEVKSINGKEAKAMMDENKQDVIFDVRTQEEYDDGHIENAVLLPYDQIDAKAVSDYEKDDVILVYCRSGNRSAKAAKTLSDLGYKNIYDFGGIQDWDYGTVKE